MAQNLLNYPLEWLRDILCASLVVKENPLFKAGLIEITVDSNSNEVDKADSVGVVVRTLPEGSKVAFIVASDLDFITQREKRISHKKMLSEIDSIKNEQGIAIPYEKISSLYEENKI